MTRFLGKESTKNPKKINVNELISDFTSDTNFFSNMGTSFTGSTAHNAGMTENVIIVGFRFMNIGSQVVNVYNNLMFNFKSVKMKLESISNVSSTINGNGSNTSIRDTCIKYSVQKR